MGLLYRRPSQWQWHQLSKELLHCAESSRGWQGHLSNSLQRFLSFDFGPRELTEAGTRTSNVIGPRSNPGIFTSNVYQLIFAEGGEGDASRTALSLLYCGLLSIGGERMCEAKEGEACGSKSELHLG